jgi:hypothetical protein
MERRISEADWKRFRELRGVALDRLCERIFTEVIGLASESSQSWHERYLEMYRRIQDRDNDVARAFNDPRRSTAYLQLAVMASLDLIEPGELEQFGPYTQEVVARFRSVQ